MVASASFDIIALNLEQVVASLVGSSSRFASKGQAEASVFVKLRGSSESIVCVRPGQVDGMLEVPVPSYFDQAYEEQHALVAVRGR